MLRIIDITDEASAPTLAPEAPDSLVIVPPTTPERSTAHSAPSSRSVKLEGEDDPDEEPANFNRVRLIKVKKRQLNQNLPEQVLSTDECKQDVMEIDTVRASSKRDEDEDSQADPYEWGPPSPFTTYRDANEDSSPMYSPKRTAYYGVHSNYYTPYGLLDDRNSELNEYTQLRPGFYQSTLR